MQTRQTPQVMEFESSQNYEGGSPLKKGSGGVQSMTNGYERPSSGVLDMIQPSNRANSNLTRRVDATNSSQFDDATLNEVFFESIQAAHNPQIRRQKFKRPMTRMLNDNEDGTTHEEN
jgi:hypothetical protein